MNVMKLRSPNEDTWPCLIVQNDEADRKEGRSVGTYIIDKQDTLA